MKVIPRIAPHVTPLALALIILAGCGGSTEPPRRTYTVSSVNNKLLPAVVYSTQTESGRILSGAVTGFPRETDCSFRLLRDRLVNGVSNPEPDATGTAPCGWTSDITGHLTVPLGAPWGTLDVAYNQ